MSARSVLLLCLVVLVAVPSMSALELSCRDSSNAQESCFATTEDKCSPAKLTSSLTVQATLTNFYACAFVGGKCCLEKCSYLSAGKCEDAGCFYDVSMSTCFAPDKMCLPYNTEAKCVHPICAWVNGMCVFKQPSAEKCPTSSTTTASNDCGPAVPGYAAALLALVGVAFMVGIGMVVIVIVRKHQRDKAEEQEREELKRVTGM
eukprot:PhM_4_TR6802/c0_g1_i1/m.59486